MIRSQKNIVSDQSGNVWKRVHCEKDTRVYGEAMMDCFHSITLEIRVSMLGYDLVFSKAFPSVMKQNDEATEEETILWKALDLEDNEQALEDLVALPEKLNKPIYTVTMRRLSNGVGALELNLEYMCQVRSFVMNFLIDDVSRQFLSDKDRYQSSFKTHKALVAFCSDFTMIQKYRKPLSLFNYGRVNKTRKRLIHKGLLPKLRFIHV